MGGIGRSWDVVYVGKHRQTSWRAATTSGHQGSNVTTIPDMEEEHR